jgi:hypothetical protein
MSTFGRDASPFGNRDLACRVIPPGCDAERLDWSGGLGGASPACATQFSRAGCAQATAYHQRASSPRNSGCRATQSFTHSSSWWRKATFEAELDPARMSVRTCPRRSYGPRRRVGRPRHSEDGKLAEGAGARQGPEHVLKERPQDHSAISRWSPSARRVPLCALDALGGARLAAPSSGAR